jgi:hypothetical protein
MVAVFVALAAVLGAAFWVPFNRWGFACLFAVRR